MWWIIGGTIIGYIFGYALWKLENNAEDDINRDLEDEYDQN